MASSQVEIASSSPFDYVHRCCGTSTRDSNSFKQNFKNLVESHLHSCISKTEFAGDKNQESGGGGVSSLVRKWRDFETGFDESCSVVMTKSESFGDWESEDKMDMSKDCDPDVKESERLGVADIIKKLKFENGSNNNVVGGGAVNGGSLPRVRTSVVVDHHSEGQRCTFSQVLSSPRFIRGRQAFSNLLLQMERDRKRELDGLVEHKAVSKFQQRGRIQVQFLSVLYCTVETMFG